MLQDQQGHVDLPWSQVGHPFDFDRVLVRTQNIHLLNEFLLALEQDRTPSQQHHCRSLPCLVESPESFPTPVLDRIDTFFSARNTEPTHHLSTMLPRRTIPWFVLAGYATYGDGSIHPGGPYAAKRPAKRDDDCIILREPGKRTIAIATQFATGRMPLDSWTD